MGLTNHLHAAGEDFAVRPRGLTRCRLVSEVLCSVKSNSWLHAISFARWSILLRNVCAGRVRNMGFHHSAHLYGVHSRVKALQTANLAVPSDISYTSARIHPPHF